jgi:hypothetical protein
LNLPPRYFVTHPVPTLSDVSLELAAYPDWTVVADPLQTAFEGTATVVVPLDRSVPFLTSDRRGVVLPYGDPEQIGRAFIQGAADYLCLPFTFTELDARVRRLELSSDSAWSYGSTVQIAGCDLVVTGSRRDVLALLYRHRGRIVDRDAVADSCGITGGEGSRSRAVDMVISRLRREIAPAPVRIETIRGIGYRLVET